MPGGYQRTGCNTSERWSAAPGHVPGRLDSAMDNQSEPWAAPVRAHQLRLKLRPRCASVYVDGRRAALTGRRLTKRRAGAL